MSDEELTRTKSVGNKKRRFRKKRELTKHMGIIIKKYQQAKILDQDQDYGRMQNQMTRKR